MTVDAIDAAPATWEDDDAGEEDEEEEEEEYLAATDAIDLPCECGGCGRYAGASLFCEQCEQCPRCCACEDEGEEGNIASE